MATSEEYAKWIVQNQDKSGTPEFETVAQAYQVSKREENAVKTTEKITPKQTTPSALEQLVGAGETGLALGTGAITGGAGMLGGGIEGLMKAISSGQYGTQEGVNTVQQQALKRAQQMTYAPRTQASQEQLQAIAPLLEAIPPILPVIGEPGMLSQGIRQNMPLAQATLQRGGIAAQEALSQMAKPLQRGSTIVKEALGFETQPSQGLFGGRVSGGAAATPMDLQRRTTAEGLPVKMDLTLGAETRNPEQLAFEKEQMKGQFGEPLRQRTEQNNLQALQNFDAVIDMTGAQQNQLTPIATGNKLIDALTKGWQGAKQRTSEAYKLADSSPEALAPVDLTKPVSIGVDNNQMTTNLIDYLNSRPNGLASTSIPDIAKKYAVNLGIAKLDQNGNLVANPTNVKNVEILRKEINMATGFEPVDIRESTILKKIIDESAKDAGGELYAQARALREQQARKYENRAIVARLITDKKGTEDPKVVAEKVFNTTVINGSAEELQFLKRVLLTSGKDTGERRNGVEAWKQVQGATVKYLQNESTKGVGTDSVGRPLISPSKLHDAVTNLDANDRLDIILGKKNAQIVRDLNEVVKYVQTVPPGTLINSSGTAGMLLGAMGEAAMAGTLTGLPLPAISLIRGINQHIKNTKVKMRIKEALNKAEVSK